MPLTKAEIDKECNRLLAPVSRYILNALGDEAASYTGLCLFKALEAYEPVKGDIDGYARSKTRLLVIDELRRVDGRKGSHKYKALSTKSGIESYDEPDLSDPSESMAHHDELVRSLQILGRATKFQRILLLGRLLVGLTDTEIQRLTNASKTKIWSESLSLRELLPSH